MTKTTLLASIILGSVLLGGATYENAFAAVDMFLKIDDIKGEAVDETVPGEEGHSDEIDVLAWSWGMSQAGSFHVGGGGGAGKVNVQDLSVTKFVDKSSTDLYKSLSEGKHFEEAILTVRKAGGDPTQPPVEYIVYTLQKVIVTSVSTGGSGEDRLTENVTLNFDKIKVEYTPQIPDDPVEPVKEWSFANKPGHR